MTMELALYAQDLPAQRCSCCKQTLALTEFYLDKYRDTGVGSYCKVCTAARDKRRREANKVKNAGKVVDLSAAKRCGGCDQVLPAAEFHKNACSADGLSARCKTCAKKTTKEWREKNHERFLGNLRRWQTENKEHQRNSCRRYYASHSKECIANSKVWAQTHPKEVRVMQERHRSRKLNAPVIDLTVEEWTQILKAYEYRCAYCGQEEEKLQQDHVIPLSRGGSHTASNIVPACKSCNASKNDRTVEEWIEAKDSARRWKRRRGMGVVLA